MALPGHTKAAAIVGDATVSSVSVGNGRLIPLVILDTRDRPEIETIIEAHRHGLAPGDVLVTWGELNGRRERVALICQFVRPVESLVVIEFAILPQGILIDQALTAKALYIQGGRPGDRLIHDLQKPKILIEVPETGFSKVWNKLFHKSNEANFRKQGFSRAESRNAARQVIIKLREFSAFRIPMSRSEADPGRQ